VEQHSAMGARCYGTSNTFKGFFQEADFVVFLAFQVMRQGTKSLKKFLKDFENNGVKTSAMVQCWVSILAREGILGDCIWIRRLEIANKIER